MMFAWNKTACWESPELRMFSLDPRLGPAPARDNPGHDRDADCRVRASACSSIRSAGSLSEFKLQPANGWRMKSHSVSLIRYPFARTARRSVPASLQRGAKLVVSPRSIRMSAPSSVKWGTGYWARTGYESRFFPPGVVAMPRCHNGEGGRSTGRQMMIPAWLAEPLR